jgi:hypothetical protein
MLFRKNVMKSIDNPHTHYHNQSQEYNSTALKAVSMNNISINTNILLNKKDANSLLRSDENTNNTNLRLHNDSLMFKGKRTSIKVGRKSKF